MDKKVISITPDKGSGDLYIKEIQTHGVSNIKQKISTIAPRVERVEITSNLKLVISDLVRAFTKAIKEEKPDIITIACNTSSLRRFVEPAFRIVSRDLDLSEGQVELVLTIDQIAEYFKENMNKKLVLLGTKPLSQILANDENVFITFANMEGATDRDLNLVQEIIWRVKAMQGSDVKTAPAYDVSLNDEKQNFEELQKLLLHLHDRLKSLKVSEVIMGCTELPAAFALMRKTVGDLGFSLVDPAILVAKKIKQIETES